MAATTLLCLLKFKLIKIKLKFYFLIPTSYISSVAMVTVLSSTDSDHAVTQKVLPDSAAV